MESRKQELGKQGKADFFRRNNWKKGFEGKKRKEIKANIYEEGLNTKKYKAIKREERKKRRTKNEERRTKTQEEEKKKVTMN
jgi:hypothetical protein